jgi:transcriptional regulator with XRE-family HTH domain
MTIGDNIKRLRHAAGHTHQGAFAQKAGLNQQWLSDMETGRIQAPQIENLLKIAAAIPCRLDDLVTGVNVAFEQSRALLSGRGQLDAAVEGLAERIQQLAAPFRTHVFQQVGFLELAQKSGTSLTTPPPFVPKSSVTRVVRPRRATRRRSRSG